MAKRYITQGELKKHTLSDIFGIILERQTTTRREIEYETGFSWGTVSSNVALLIEKGFVAEEKSEQTAGAGRTTYMLKPNAKSIVSIGLDINRSGLSCEVVGLDRVTVKSFEAPFCAETQNEVLKISSELCQTAIDWCEDQSLRVFSLGIAVQGAVNGKLGVCMRFPKIPDWQAYNVKEYFAKRFELPVYLGHDPRCMLLGQMRTSRAADNVLVRIDGGIGMAVSIDGKIVDDTERFELGHILVTDKDGSEERLDNLVTLTSMAKTAGVAQDELFNSPEKFDEIFTHAGSLMAKAIYNTFILFKPQRIILTGKAVRLEKFINTAITLLEKENVEIIKNPNISAAYGAAIESMHSAVKSSYFFF